MAGDTLGTTPSQTVGPFFALSGGILWEDGPEVVGADEPGAIVVHGRVLDGNGDPVPDAVVETWQADSQGRFDHFDDSRGESTSFRGFGRCGTDPEGRYWIRTVKPGTLPTPDGATEAPHIDVTVLARGLLNRVVTRIYFPEEQEANAADPVLSTVDAGRRGTLIAAADSGGYQFDIRLQGDDETLFFAV
ncbi:protocatechuate 3,4-dioxygenase alpha subunit [Halopolyspora algeriensis]|uniref:Protocatechuate 3,4-dioxygenase alpha subunit n=1 Tax=Halopolyspora algeriensis TaxID=1500506 RepID=A0A368VWH2_9ACTN|nr:protocatechuate 3,4-dioxygenase subunit alpha [Halopolyspora algeriensis]RCW46199.1 protocatechuate 3,4-dioxygenase alpha subunit [Halopolyspora algeriensis]TQM55602.1 protocatechuate 3,4-dioxygenase alpha subunit [Halopolyspora algeriensis]